MKLFSRKALVAGAAAVALSFAGTSAAVAEETGQVTTSPAAPVEDPNKTQSFFQKCVFRHIGLP